MSEEKPLSLREQLLALKRVVIEPAKEFPGWPKVGIKLMDGFAREQWSVANSKMDSAGNKVGGRTMANLIACTLVDIETGQHIFSIDDVDEINKLDGDVLLDWFAHAHKLNKLGADDIEDEKKA